MCMCMGVLDKIQATDSVFALQAHRSVSNMYSDFLPDSYDARVGWEECLGFSVIHSQGNCSACCPMAVSSALSARECMRNGRNVLFSAQQLWNCARDFAVDGCDKGTRFDRMVKNMAELQTKSKMLIPESCAVFSPAATESAKQHETCVDVYDQCLSEKSSLVATSLWSSVHANELNLGIGGSGKNFVAINAAKALMAEVWINGPVVAVLSMNSKDFQVFESLEKGHAVFVPGNETLIQAGSITQVRHCVVVYGWGQDAKTGVNYWLIQNSYGKKWGGGGRGRVVRGYNWLENEWRGLSTQDMKQQVTTQVPCEASSAAKSRADDDYCLSSSTFNQSIAENKMQMLMDSGSAMNMLNFLLSMNLHNSSLFPFVPVNPPTFVKLKEFSRVSNGEIWAITWACSLGLLLSALAFAYFWKTRQQLFLYYN